MEEADVVGLARTWATGSMVLWVVVLLGICLIAYYY